MTIVVITRNWNASADLTPSVQTIIFCQKGTAYLSFEATAPIDREDGIILTAGQSIPVSANTPIRWRSSAPASTDLYVGTYPA